MWKHRVTLYLEACTTLRRSFLAPRLGLPIIASTRLPIVSHGLKQKRLLKRREKAASQASGDKLLRPLTIKISTTSHLASTVIKAALRSTTLSYLPGRLASPLT